nr:AAA family ATPase [Rhabdothermincola salaria]
MIGRHGELAALMAALAGAAAGRGAAAVVLGEPGVGKTRLVEEVAAAARQRGFVTAWARCPESGATPSFWSATHLAEQVREAGVVDRVLVPPDEYHQSSEVAPGAVFALYRAVVDTLRSAKVPLLLVIDDLQWADADSLRLLVHVAGELTDLSILVVVTVRPLEDDSGVALVDALGALSRTPGIVQVPLFGLEKGAVSEWLAARTGVDVPSDVAALVHDRTGGNPLFVKELSELLASEGRLTDASAARAATAIPPGVQFVVRRRVARLPAPTQQLLTVASVVGRRFELTVVATVAEEPLDAALDALAPALDAGLVVDEEGGRFRFSHALVCDALAAEVNSVRSARIHAAVARTVARRTGPVLGSSAALVAHHAMAGAMAGTAELAIEASTEAARLASDQFGFEDAAGHWARVVESLASFRPGDLAGRIGALCNLAAVRFEADLVEAARRAALEAMELAEVAGDVAALGRAAALLGSPHLWPNQSYGTVDPRCIAALRRTADLLDHGDFVSRALVLGALAVELTYGDSAAIEGVRSEAVEAARASGDPYVLGRVMLNASGPLEPTKLAERRRSALEVLELVETHGLDDHLALIARFQLALTHYESADHDGAASHIAECRAVADRIGGGPLLAQLGWFQGAMALAHGRYEEAQALCSEAALRYRRTRRMDADLMEMAQVAAIAADRGGIDATMPRIRAAAAASPHYGRLAAEFSGWLVTEAGRLDMAASVVDQIDTGIPFADDYTMLSAATYGLHTRVSLGDIAGASAIASQLEPFEGRWAATGSGGGSAGLVGLALARSAVLLGDTERARTLFDEAVAGHERLRTPAWLARSLLYQGRFLLDMAGPGDRSRGEDALRRVEALASTHDLVYVARQVAESRR